MSTSEVHAFWFFFFLLFNLGVIVQTWSCPKVKREVHVFFSSSCFFVTPLLLCAEPEEDENALFGYAAPAAGAQKRSPAGSQRVQLSKSPSTNAPAAERRISPSRSPSSS